MERELDWSRVQRETARDVTYDLEDLLTNIADALADPVLIKALPLPAYGVLLDMSSALVTLNRLVELKHVDARDLEASLAITVPS